MPRLRIHLPSPAPSPWPKPKGHPDLLQDGREIARFVEAMSPHPVDAGLIEDMYHGCTARLQWLPLERLQPGPAEAHVADARRERRYAKMPAADCPPLLVDEGCIQDGHHRYRVAVARGDAGLWCYVIEEAGTAS